MPKAAESKSTEAELCSRAARLARLACRLSFRLGFPGARATELVATAEGREPPCVMSLTKSRSLDTTGSWISFCLPEDPALFPELRFLTSFRASVKPEIVIDLGFSTRPGWVLLSVLKSILTGIDGLLVGNCVESGRL